MQASSVLKNEHRVIEQVLSCLEKMAEQAMAGGKLDGVSAGEALDFFQNFADKCHHGKEESLLFPLLEARGLSSEGGPTGVMRHEHEEGRGLIRGMSESAPAAAASDRNAVKRFAGYAFGFVRLMRNHVFKEDHRLFPMADHVLNESDQRRLLDEFAHAEHHEKGAGTHDNYIKLADNLADLFKVRRNTVTH